MDPYSYVGGNPETRTDPTGKCVADPNTGECYRPPTPGGCSNGQVKDGSGNCVDPGPNINDCRADDSLKGCNTFSCADLGGPMSTNNCTYHDGGDCNGKTYRQCVTLHNEKRDAANAKQHFQDVAGKLTGLGFWMIGLAFAAIGLWINPVLAALIAGIMAGLSLLNLLAGKIADAFSAETDKAHLEADRQNIHNFAFGYGSIGSGGGFLFALVSDVLGVAKGVAGGVEATDFAVTGIAAGNAFAIGEMLTSGIGAVIFVSQADDYINQEEADLA